MTTPIDANKLGALWSTLDREMARAMDGHSATAAAMLLWLYHGSPTGVVELCRVVGVSQPAGSRAIDKLVQAGFFHKLSASAREVWLELSPAGRAEAERLQGRRLTACGSLLGALTPQEQVTMSALLDKLLTAPVIDRGYARNVCRFCDHAVCDGPACPVGCRATQIERAAAA
ncbi:MAG: winged helix-turn-helix transcriptional regulator [Ramlibacter sp.]|nr:winged helix-turn-helix transcriptional regulator [Ramlibacter sp.]